MTQNRHQLFRICSGVLMGAVLNAWAVAGVEPACQAVIDASVARAAMPASAQVAQVKNMTMEMISVDGKAYIRNNNEKWKSFGVTIAQAERDAIAQMKSGQIKLSKCKAGADAVIDGVATRSLSYIVEMTGAPAESSTVFIGKSDGLPYAQQNSKMKVRYRYKGVTAPKL